VLVTLVAVLAGTAFAVRRAAALPPAEAMRPEPPPVYRATLLERLGLQRRLAEPSRMIVRHIARQPLQGGADHAGHRRGRRHPDDDQLPARCHRLDGRRPVRAQQPRGPDGDVHRPDAAARLVLARRRWTASCMPRASARCRPGWCTAIAATALAVTGLEPGSELQRVLDMRRCSRCHIPAEGILLTEYLAREILDIRPGELLTIEVLEGRRPVLEVPVAGTTREYLGVNAYMSREALNRLMREGPAISGARLAVDPAAQVAIYRDLRDMPRVAGTIVRDTAIEQFNEMMEETILYFSFITALLGGFIAFGVVYNSARIALSERSRELASLRVLGFTRGEVGYILLGEIGLLTLLAIPLGFGSAAAVRLSAAGLLLGPVPHPAHRRAVHLCAGGAIVLVSFAITGALIWRKLARLDLIEVLKTGSRACRRTLQGIADRSPRWCAGARVGLLAAAGAHRDRRGRAPSPAGDGRGRRSHAGHGPLRAVCAGRRLPAAHRAGGGRCRSSRRDAGGARPASPGGARSARAGGGRGAGVGRALGAGARRIGPCQAEAEAELAARSFAGARILLAGS
jgi:putative ABC transport system permease protein